MLKARPCIRARATATAVGSRMTTPVGGVSSLRTIRAGLSPSERRTSARFLHTSSRLRPAELKPGVTRAGPQRRALLRRDRQQDFYSRYLYRPGVRHSARLDVARSKEDTTWSFVGRRDSPNDDDGGNFLASGKSEKVLPWQGAVLRRSGDSGFGRFVIRRSPTSSKSGHASRSSCSADLYGLRYSSPTMMRSPHTPAVRSSLDRSSPSVGKPDVGEQLIHADLLVGFQPSRMEHLLDVW